ncbi:hypothetical protein ACKXGD_18130, partial [Enterococcus lactis]|uniref:hypothetical protein n=1 Tax=Enterococcus lactis TaxID=357441 RepID=UPI0039081351
PVFQTPRLSGEHVSLRRHPKSRYTIVHYLPIFVWIYRVVYPITSPITTTVRTSHSVSHSSFDALI